MCNQLLAGFPNHHPEWIQNFEQARKRATPPMERGKNPVRPAAVTSVILKVQRVSIGFHKRHKTLQRGNT